MIEKTKYLIKDVTVKYGNQRFATNRFKVAGLKFKVGGADVSEARANYGGRQWWRFPHSEEGDYD